MIRYTTNKTQLVFSVSDPDAFAEFVADNQDRIYSDDCFLDAIEQTTCNGLHLIQPEYIGALTDSLLFSESIIHEESSATDQDIVYWFPDYAIRSPLQDLIDNGSCTFTSEVLTHDNKYYQL